jgi:uncharacterized repeat protein (TIGR03803 family)
MTNSLQHWSRCGCAVLFVLMVFAAPPGQGKKFSVLYSFTGQPDGLRPYAGLIRDTAGNLYSTTTVGGSAQCSFFGDEEGCGTVFKLDNTGKETVLYDFTGGDGEYPMSGLVQAPSGTFFGTTLYGGTGYCSDDGLDAGCGTVFALDTAGRETVLHSFVNSPDGANPDRGGVILDPSGDLYGTTFLGGAYGYGTVFTVDTTGKETVLYSFCAQTNCADGMLPRSALIRDKPGTLYGTTTFGGAHGWGTVFKIDTTGKETVLYSFKGQPDGISPVGGMIRDAEGNFYGTTEQGGMGCGGSGCGTVFKLDTTGKEHVLYRFKGAASKDGADPDAALVRDGKGNFYGTTAWGGTFVDVGICESNGCGTVYKLIRSGKETVLHNFSGRQDGAYPDAVLLRDAHGNLYGTVTSGGGNACKDGCGVVFKITP